MPAVGNEEVVDDFDVVFDSVDDDIDFEDPATQPPAEDDSEQADETPEETAEETDDDDLGVPVTDDSEFAEEAEFTPEEEKSYSASVKKRIKREIALRKSVQTDLVTVQQRAQQYADALNKGSASYSNLQQQHDSLQEQYYKLLDTSMQSAAEQKTAELQAAKEQGNTAAEIQLQSAIEELRFNRRQLAEITSSFTAQKAAREQQRTTAPAAQPQAQPPALAVAWVARNKWIQEPKYAPHREYLSVIDEKLRTRGLNQNNPEYYREVDKELRKAFPPKKVAKKTTSPVSGVSSLRTVSTGNSSRKSITLTRADIATMKNFGLNPENKQHVLAFAKQRMNSNHA